MSTWTAPGYRDLLPLGQADSGRTMLASHVATGSPVAIRYLANDLCQDEEYLSQYRAAARVLCELESPNMAELYEYVEGGDGVATVREYVTGCSLRELLATSRTIRPELALTVLKGGLRGLAAAHERGITHRRVTPANLLIDRDGGTKLADFGFCSTHCSPADDVRAAFATFLQCLTGSPVSVASATIDPVAAGGMPKRLQPLTRVAESGDGAALLTELDAVAGAAYGADWEAKSRRRLAQQAHRLSRRGRG